MGVAIPPICNTETFHLDIGSGPKIQQTAVFLLRAVASGGANQFLAEQLTLSQPDYTHYSTISPPSGFLDLATALRSYLEMKMLSFESERKMGQSATYY